MEWNECMIQRRIWRVIPKWKQQNLQKHFRSFAGHSCLYFCLAILLHWSLWHMSVPTTLVCSFSFGAWHFSFSLSLFFRVSLGIQWNKYNFQCAFASFISIQMLMWRDIERTTQPEHIYSESNLLLKSSVDSHCMCEHENNYFVLCIEYKQLKWLSYAALSWIDIKLKTYEWMKWKIHDMHSFPLSMSEYCVCVCLGVWRFMSELPSKTRSSTML